MSRTLPLAPVLVLLAPVLDELVHRPEADTTRTLRASRRMEMELVEREVSLEVDGETQDEETPEIELRLREERGLAITDDLEAVEGTRVTKLVRTFDELTSTSTRALTDPDGKEHEDSKERESELEGESVVFTWDADAEEYAVAWAGDEAGGDDELLEPLVAELGFDLFLPGKDVAEGDEWDVPVRAWALVRRPGGDVSIDDSQEENAPDYGTQYDDHLEGTIRARYAGVEEVDGERIARIAFTADLETWMEEERELDIPNAESTLKRRMEVTLELEGALLWDVAANQARSFEASGDTTAEVQLEQEITGDLQSMSELRRNETMRFEGTESYSMRFE